jgi:hypothetical protein
VLRPGAGAQGTSSDPIDVESMDPKCPLWRHVNKIKGSNPFGGNAKSECKFCEKVITVSYTRVRAHLLKIPNCGVSICKKVTIPTLEQLQKEVAEAEAIKEKKQTGIEESVHTEIRQKADALIARMFYSAGLHPILRHQLLILNMIIVDC